MLMSDMIDGCRTETAIGQNSPIVRPPVGGVPIFPPGTVSFDSRSFSNFISI